MYLTRSPQLLGAIQAGVESRDYDAVTNAAHSLISSAGNLGGLKVSNLAAQMEIAAHQKNTRTMAELNADLIRSAEPFQTHIKLTLEQL